MSAGPALTGLLVVLCAVAVSGQAGRPAARQGGVVKLLLTDSTDAHGSLRTGTVILAHYAGEPMQALQLMILVRGGAWITEVHPGIATADPAGWLVSSVVPERRSGRMPETDTVRVVLLARTTRGLPSGDFHDLLRFTFAHPPGVKSRRVTFELQQVLGALATGDNAGIVAGPARSLTIR